jgi:hypothetical protein
MNVYFYTKIVMSLGDNNKHFIGKVFSLQLTLIFNMIWNVKLFTNIGWNLFLALLNMGLVQ